jgi:hypothetical protein
MHGCRFLSLIHALFVYHLSQMGSVYHLSQICIICHRWVCTSFVTDGIYEPFEPEMSYAAFGLKLLEDQIPVSAQVDTYTHAHTHTHIQHTYTYKHTYAHTHKQTNTHTHTCTQTYTHNTPRHMNTHTLLTCAR